MLQKWIGELKETPARLAQRRNEFTEAARTRARTVRNDSQDRLWSFQTNALGRAEDALDNAPGVPVVSHLAEAAGKLVARRLDRLTAVTITNYDELNARKAITEIKGLSTRMDLLAVRRHEEGAKARKTVLKAIDGRLARAA